MDDVYHAAVVYGVTIASSGVVRGVSKDPVTHMMDPVHRALTGFGDLSATSSVVRAVPQTNTDVTNTVAIAHLAMMVFGETNVTSSAA